MDENARYLLHEELEGPPSATSARDPDPAAVPAAERSDSDGIGTPELLDLLRERLGDEAVRRAIARLLAPR